MQGFEEALKRGLEEKAPEGLKMENPQDISEELKRRAKKGPVNKKGETYLIEIGGKRIAVAHLPQ